MEKSSWSFSNIIYYIHLLQYPGYSEHSINSSCYRSQYFTSQLYCYHKRFSKWTVTRTAQFYTWRKRHKLLDTFIFFLSVHKTALILQDVLRTLKKFNNHLEPLPVCKSKIWVLVPAKGKRPAPSAGYWLLLMNPTLEWH